MGNILVPEKFTREIVVAAHDIDELSHVNNVTYLQWVQDMAQRHWLARASPSLLKFKWVALNHYIAYKKPAFLGDTITAQTFIGKTEGVRCERFAEFYKGEQLLVKARSEWCMVEEKTLKPVRVPDDMKALFMQKI